MTDLIERLLDKAPHITAVVMLFGAMGLVLGWAYICSLAFGGGFPSLIVYLVSTLIATVAYDIRTALRAKETDNG